MVFLISAQIPSEAAGSTQEHLASFLNQHASFVKEDKEVRAELEKVVQVFRQCHDKVEVLPDLLEIKMRCLEKDFQVIKGETQKQLQAGEWRTYQKISCEGHTVIASLSFLPAILELIGQEYEVSNREHPKFTAKEIQGQSALWLKTEPLLIKLCDGYEYTGYIFQRYNYSNLDDVFLNVEYVLHRYAG
jgi:hypothetical protein